MSYSSRCLGSTPSVGGPRPGSAGACLPAASSATRRRTSRRGWHVGGTLCDCERGGTESVSSVFIGGFAACLARIEDEHLAGARVAEPELAVVQRHAVRLGAGTTATSRRTSPLVGSSRNTARRFVSTHQIPGSRTRRWARKGGQPQHGRQATGGRRGSRPPRPCPCGDRRAPASGERGRRVDRAGRSPPSSGRSPRARPRAVRAHTAPVSGFSGVGKQASSSPVCGSVADDLEAVGRRGPDAARRVERDPLACLRASGTTGGALHPRTPVGRRGHRPGRSPRGHRAPPAARSAGARRLPEHASLHVTPPSQHYGPSVPLLPRGRGRRVRSHSSPRRPDHSPSPRPLAPGQSCPRALPSRMNEPVDLRRVAVGAANRPERAALSRRFASTRPSTSTGRVRPTS